MTGKREGVRRWSRLPGILALIAATALLVPSATSQGVDSPLQETVTPPAAVEETAPVLPVEKTRAAVPEEPLPPAPAEPVEETEPVEDSYFKTAAFLGDSRTDGFRLYSGLKTGTYYVATGATVESVFTKEVETAAGKMPLLDALALTETEPERIYVMLGVNELGWATIENYHDYYAKLIDRLRQDHPGAEVILQSLPPVSAQQEEQKTYVNNARIARYNEVVRQLAGEKACPFVDVAQAVTDEEGCLPAEWTYDGVHLNTKGCKAWLDYLRTHPVGHEPPTEEGEITP